MAEASERRALLRSLPSVHALLGLPQGRDLVATYGHRLAADTLAQEQAEARRHVREAPADRLDPNTTSADVLLERAARRLARLTRRSLRRVINATGVIVHTNLGRSRLADVAVRAAAEAAAGYSTLEYDLDAGERGSRQAHIERLLALLTGAEAGMAVNNNAAAVLLALAATAAGGEVIVSRGELVEIGGAFRVPDVMAQSGVRLVEVGTTNKTRPDDYRRAIGPQTAALLKVHTSNYRIVGFSEDTPLGELVRLGDEFGLPVLYDLGSGALIDLAAHGVGDEPTVRGAVETGASLVMCSGDKLLGGPQAGLIVGRSDNVRACARHSLARALRVDKMTLAALEATLLLYLDGERACREIPTLRMLLASPAELARRAASLADRLREVLPNDASVEVREERSQPGGGSLPGVELESFAVAIRRPGWSTAALERALRNGEPPVVARVVDDRLILDLRTIAEDEIETLIAAVREAASNPAAGGMLAGT